MPTATQGLNQERQEEQLRRPPPIPQERVARTTAHTISSALHPTLYHSNYSATSMAMSTPSMPHGTSATDSAFWIDPTLFAATFGTESTTHEAHAYQNFTSLAPNSATMDANMSEVMSSQSRRKQPLPLQIHTATSLAGRSDNVNFTAPQLSPSNEIVRNSNDSHLNYEGTRNDNDMAFVDAYNAEHQAAVAAAEVANLAVRHAEAQRTAAAAAVAANALRQKQQQQQQQQMSLLRNQAHRDPGSRNRFRQQQHFGQSTMHPFHPHSAGQMGNAAARSNNGLSLSTGNALDDMTFMSPLVYPNDQNSMMWDNNGMLNEDEQSFFTPLVSPAMTPSFPYGPGPAMSTNANFSPLTSPALSPMINMRPGEWSPSSVPSMSLGFSALPSSALLNGNRGRSQDQTMANARAAAAVAVAAASGGTRKVDNVSTAKRPSTLMQPNNSGNAFKRPRDSATGSNSEDSNRSTASPKVQTAGHPNAVTLNPRPSPTSGVSEAGRKMASLSLPCNQPKEKSSISPKGSMPPPSGTPPSSVMKPITCSSIMQVSDAANDHKRRRQSKPQSGNTNISAVGLGANSLISPALHPSNPTIPTSFKPMHPSALMSPSLHPMASPTLKPTVNTSTSDASWTANGDDDDPENSHARKTTHKVAEQRRRDDLKQGLISLKMVLPNLEEKSPSKIYLVRKAVEHICELHSIIEERDAVIASLKSQLEAAKNSGTPGVTDPYSAYASPLDIPTASTNEMLFMAHQHSAATSPEFQPTIMDLGDETGDLSLGQHLTMM